MNCARASGRTTAPAVATAALPPAPVLVMACSPECGSAPAVFGSAVALLRDGFLVESCRAEHAADDGARGRGHAGAAHDRRDGDQHGLGLLHREAGFGPRAEGDQV